MRMRAFCFVVAGLLTAADLAADPVVQFEERAVVARGVSVGGSTVWFAVAHERQPYHLRIVDRTVIIDDDDRDGVVRLSLDRPVPRHAVWIVIDLATGLHGIASLSPSGIRRRPLTPGAIRRQGDDLSLRIVERHEYLTFIYIRPHVGAWTSTIDDGGSQDGDLRDDGQVTAVLSHMQPLGRTPIPPLAPIRGDVVFAVAPLTLEIFDAEVTE